MVQIEMGVLVTIVLAVLGLIGALIGLLYKMHTGTIRDISRRVEKLETTELVGVQKKLDDEIAARNKKHDEAFTRVYGRIETLEKDVHRVEINAQKQLSDLEITTASFGGTYATRRDVEQLRDDLHGKRR